MSSGVPYYERDLVNVYDKAGRSRGAINLARRRTLVAIVIILGASNNLERKLCPNTISY